MTITRRELALAVLGLTLLGVVQDKAAFIAGATDGKSRFTSLEYQDVRIRVVGPAAIVRFH
jgi:hypothetical protein